MELDALLLSRIQFAMTIGFHFIFPPLTIGLAWLIVALQTKYLRTGDELYNRISRFWIKLFAISFVMGVASGVVMEFQFGTNWSEYSRFVGDIFGAPLAAEGIFAFFLESAFVGVLVWGADRVSKRFYWFSSLMVALGSTFSAFWIIVANSWQQTPAGFHIVNGRAELTDFWAAVFNPSTIPRYLHTMDGAIITGAFFMLGISALYLLRGKHREFAKYSLKLSLVVALAASLLQGALGHYHAVQVAETQPAKLAAFEGLFETQQGAPLIIFGIPDAEAGRTKMEIALPKMLSFVAFGDFNAEVKGLNDFPRDEWPPLAMTFYPFHLMVALGLYFIALTCWGFWLLIRNKLYDNPLFLKLAFFSIPLPFITNELGWIAAEVGRQPWVVYNLLRTADGVSITVPAYQILFSIIMFALIYVVLFSVWIFLLRKKINLGPDMQGKGTGADKGVTV
ncbi:cytochrome ubiquinol oxidase subunit I [Desulforamulus aquiferis]|uniref:Cytochrome ubiquinol oxidase subunit I n=1 Tax=Desulforamulus aquiferis TaxID=1397668 RepID=A0AAW7ZB48_9FIRM|nr:cytochrome ubiquinol oxidase subunit I [Desulforamulus aquiferis]MDO7786938.1 cytochrome ubiquinol oxidase subunit I [Desulforamulus aquiferis]